MSKKKSPQPRSRNSRLKVSSELTVTHPSSSAETDKKRKETPEAGKVGFHAFSVVGIGASAGGFEAFGNLLSHLPGDSGMAFVLVQHLDPTHSSQLSELLSRSSPLPVREIKNGMKVEPNHIYVMPQNVDLRLAKGRLRLSPRRGQSPHLPVDDFFQSLAGEQKEMAIGVVLSGNASDGTLGLEAIKAAGGITFAQDEKTAKFFGMPGSAIAAGCVDFVLNPENIAAELGRMARHPLLRSPSPATEESEPLPPEVERVFQETNKELSGVFTILRTRSGVDFSLYKYPTLKRRILRRMVLHKIDTLSAYLKLLQSNPSEVDALFNDILIGVTSFFRDPGAFQALRKKVFPKLLKRRAADGALRAWVCGCSNGAEVYSLAIALTEFLEGAHAHRDIQIFGTDISDAALEKARAGLYPPNALQEVSPERLRRFFVKTNGAYQINKTLRDMCVFARQNVLADPPFSHLDLVSCRNVLIYFAAPLQRRVLPIFHYALEPGGFLMLGSSESVTAASDLFALVENKSKIYEKLATGTRPGFVFPTRPTMPESSAIPRAAIKPPPLESMASPDTQEQVDRLILSRFSPAAVVINRQMDVLQFRGHTGRYLEHPPGAASLNLLRMARENLALDLRAVISKAMRKGNPVRQDRIHFQSDGEPRELKIEVIPFQAAPSMENCFLVLFEEGAATGPARAAAVPARAGKVVARSPKEAVRREVSELQEELAWTKGSLQAIIEEQEATNEELKSANEEIQSSNEELQSTNEELETGKEELQSTNEELTTLNAELQDRNHEITQVNDDLTNLLSSVNMAIIMLGSDLLIRRFTPMAERLFNLIPSDLGRRLSDMNRSIVVPDLDHLIQQVVQDLSFIDREIQDKSGRWYSLRIRPYRTVDNRIDGAVLLLVDIDDQHRAVEEVMAMVNQPLLALRRDLRVKKANARFYELFQARPEETEDRPIYELGNGQWNIPELRVLLEEVLPKNQQVDHFLVQADFPGLGPRRMVVNARKFYEEGKGLPLILLAIEEESR